MAKNKKIKTPMEKLTAGYEKFIRGKQINSKSYNTFNTVIKKAATSKKQK